MWQLLRYITSLEVYFLKDLVTYFITYEIRDGHLWVANVAIVAKETTMLGFERNPKLVGYENDRWI